MQNTSSYAKIKMHMSMDRTYYFNSNNSDASLYIAKLQ